MEKTIKLTITIPVEIDTEDGKYTNTEIVKAFEIFKEDIIADIDRVFPFDQGVFSAHDVEIIEEK